MPCPTLCVSEISTSAGCFLVSCCKTDGSAGYLLIKRRSWLASVPGVLFLSGIICIPTTTSCSQWNPTGQGIWEGWTLGVSGSIWVGCTHESFGGGRDRKSRGGSRSASWWDRGELFFLKKRNRSPITYERKVLCGWLGWFDYFPATTFICN